MIGAIIVLFKPDHRLLSRLLNSVATQVSNIYIIDNTPESQKSDYYFLEKFNNITYKTLSKNYGIATAQNKGIILALADSCKHIILLDQDSTLTPGMITGLIDAEKKLTSSGKMVAAIGPLFIDEKSGCTASAIRHAFLHTKKIATHPNMMYPIEADYIISSGSLINTDTLRDTGFMMEELFIDWVDIEWGLRAKNNGYSCFINPPTIMYHSIGDETVSIAGKPINLHNTIRNYYIVRNATYLLRKNTWDGTGVVLPY